MEFLLELINNTFADEYPAWDFEKEDAHFIAFRDTYEPDNTDHYFRCDISIDNLSGDLFLLYVIKKVYEGGEEAQEVVCSGDFVVQPNLWQIQTLGTIIGNVFKKWRNTIRSN